MVEEIKRLAKSFKSQKKDYPYMLEGYEKHLPKEAENVLEIGCLYGGFSRVLKTIYPNARIELVDLFHPDYTWTVKEAELHGFIPHQGSQDDLEFLSTIKTQFDVIVEDGSHHSDDQIITFKYLFENNLKPGGLYVLEDLHCCTEEYWRCGLKFEETFLYKLQTRNFEGLTDKVSHFELINDSIAFIFKYGNLR